MLNRQFGLEFGAWEKELSSGGLGAISAYMVIFAIKWMDPSRENVKNENGSGFSPILRNISS